MNGFEALPLFAAAVLIAQLLHAPQSSAICSPRLHRHRGCIWPATWRTATLRSVAWFAALLCVIGLFVISA